MLKPLSRPLDLLPGLSGVTILGSGRPVFILDVPRLLSRERSSAPATIQLDALREVANIGCGHAANALSRLVGGSRVDLSVPRAMVTVASRPPSCWAATSAGDWRRARDGGRAERGVLFVLPARMGPRWASLLLGQQVRGGPSWTARCAKRPTSSPSACLSAIGKLTRWKLLPTVARAAPGHGRARW